MRATCEKLSAALVDTKKEDTKTINNAARDQLTGGLMATNSKNAEAASGPTDQVCCPTSCDHASFYGARR